MNNHFHDQVKGMTQVRKAKLDRQATETVAQAQVALDKAQASYNAMGTSSHAYDVTEGQERVEAAQRHEPVAPRLMCSELRTELRTAGGI